VHKIKLNPMKNKSYFSIIFALIFFLQPLSFVNVVQAQSLISTITVTNANELQNAINSAVDGGVIELTSGTYISAATEGFNLDNLGKRLTIQAGIGQNVIISGGVHRAMHIINTDFNANKQITLNRIVFKQGASNQTYRAGGISVEKGQVVFKDTTFESFSNSDTSAGPGGVLIGYNSVAFFINCSWLNNSAQAWGGGLGIVSHSRVYIHNSTFQNNRTNLPNHALMAAGGAIFIHDSTLRVSNTAFISNQAGYVAGAIYSYGSWNNPVTTPTTDIIISNCTFKDNKALQVSGSHFSPTEGGAIHAENQVLARIYNSRFITNSSENGAGLSLYRSTVQVENSVFLGNKAYSVYANGASGGAIALNSNDTSVDGNNNRPSASLTILNSWIQGRYGSVTSSALTGGGITINGDYNRQTGSNGVTRGGTVTENRANVTIDSTVFADLDVSEIPAITSLSALGGAIVLSLGNLTLTNSMIILSDASAPSLGGSSGGAMAIMLQSDANISNVTFARNTAGYAGGAIFHQGSNLNISNSILSNNELGPGNASALYGSAIFAAPDIGRSVSVTGTIQGSTITGNIGRTIYDDDRYAGPVNDIHYNNNSIYSASMAHDVYCDPMSCGLTVTGLNSVTINRGNGTSTKKALINNQNWSSAPVTGAILGVPSKLSTAAPGDVTPTDSYMAYAWTGGAATVDSKSVTNGAGYSSASDGIHTLQVGSQSYSTAILPAVSPSISLSLFQNTVNWSITGTYLDSVVSQNLAVTNGRSGGVTVPKGLDDVFVLVITKEGGVYRTFPNLLASSNFPFKSYVPICIK
jgi:hypothetical protein